MISKVIHALKTTWDGVINGAEPVQEHDTPVVDNLTPVQHPQHLQHPQSSQSWIRTASQNGRRRIDNKSGGRIDPENTLGSRTHYLRGDIGKEKIHTEDKQNYKRYYDYDYNKNTADPLNEQFTSPRRRKYETEHILGDDSTHDSRNNQSPSNGRLYHNISQHEPNWARIIKDKEDLHRQQRDDRVKQKYPIDSIPSLSTINKRQRTGLDSKRPIVYQASSLLAQDHHSTPHRRPIYNIRTTDFTHTAARRVFEKPAKCENAFSNPNEQQDNVLSYDKHIRNISKETPFKVNSQRHLNIDLRYSRDNLKNGPLRNDDNIVLDLNNGAEKKTPSDSVQISTRKKSDIQASDDPLNHHPPIVSSAKKFINDAPNLSPTELEAQLRDYKEEVKILRSRVKRLKARMKEKDALLKKYHDQYLKSRESSLALKNEKSAISSQKGQIPPCENLGHSSPNNNNRPYKESTLVKPLKSDANNVSLDTTKIPQLNRAIDSKIDNDDSKHDRDLSFLSPINRNELQNL